MVTGWKLRSVLYGAAVIGCYSRYSTENLRIHGSEMKLLAAWEPRSLRQATWKQHRFPPLPDEASGALEGLLDVGIGHSRGKCLCHMLQGFSSFPTSAAEKL